MYGDLEYCKLMRDKTTQESKGYAYVKYFKASHAAVAVEEVSSTVAEGMCMIPSKCITKPNRCEVEGIDRRS